MTGENGQIKTVEGIHFQTGEPIAVHIRDGYIDEIQPINKKKDGLSWLGPGFVDLQINGYGGIDFNSRPLSIEKIQEVTRAIWKEGVTSYYPTVITNSDDAIEASLQLIAQACEADERVASSVPGIHLEGPFITKEDGPRGAHPQEYVKAPDWSLFERWQEASGGRIKLITLSPEWPGSADFISLCVENGVKVSIGHTAASSEHIQEAVAAGATMSTHLGNGAHPTLPRHPNYIWEQLAQDQLWTCLIADGFHLPQSVLKVMIKAKGSQAMIVSDAVYLSGMPSGEYDTHIGGKVKLTPEGKLHIADNPKILAGSAQMVQWGVEYLVKNDIVNLPEAWEMASVRPARFMNLHSINGFTRGALADVVAFDWKENQLNIHATYKRGQLMCTMHDE